jgi:hypothetical protein
MIYLPRSAVLALYVLSALPGISAVADLGGVWASDVLYEARRLPTAVHAWAGLPPLPKVHSMVQYVVFTCLVGLVISLSFLMGRLCFWPSQLTRGQSIGALAYCFSVVLLPFASWLAPLIFPLGFGMGLWLILVAAPPVLVLVSDGLQREAGILIGRKIFRVSYLPILCGLLLISSVIFLYQTSWNSRLIFQNEFSALPEYTKLASGEWVENNAFIRENRLHGRALDDPCSEKDAGLLCIRIPRNSFESPRAAFLAFPIGSGLSYDWDREILLSYRPLNDKECLQIRAWVRSAENYCKLASTAESKLASTAEKKSSPFFLLDQRIEEFYHLNISTIDLQTHLGRFFFHHAYFYLPVLHSTMDGEIRGDIPASPLPIQYGQGLTQVFSAIFKIMDDSSFENYFRIYWIGPGLYLLLCVFAVYGITGRGDLAVAMGALVVILFPFELIVAMRLAPGFNPWRHLPDVLCFWSVSWYATRPSWRSGALRATSIALLFWWNREFGLFMLAGSLAWHFLSIAQGHGRQLRLIGQATLEILLVIFAHLFFSPGVVGENELMAYNLLGVGIPPTRWLDVFLYAALWGGLLILTVWLRRKAESAFSSSALDVAGVGFAYAAFCSTYALWNPSPNHSLVVWLCASVPIICLVSAGIARMESVYFHVGRQLSIYFSTVLTVLALFSAAYAGLSHQHFVKGLFTNHRVFEWKFPSFNGRTTADPAPVAASLELVNLELPTGPLTLLSRHDVLFHVVSGRLSTLPYIDVTSALIGLGMIDSMRTRIEAIRPEVIFMDTDIFDPREPELYGFGATVSPPAVLRHRAGHLAALGLLAREVGQCYRPGPASGLLRAWYRTCK